MTSTLGLRDRLTARQDAVERTMSAPSPATSRAHALWQAGDQRQPRPAAGAFGIALRRLRDTRGISQARLAELADYDHSYLSRLESGAKQPTRTAVEMIAVALDATPTDTAGLLAAAGFLPADVALIAPDATAWRVGQLLADPAVPPVVKQQIRGTLELLIVAATKDD